MKNLLPKAAVPIALFLFVVTVIIRLNGITTLEPQADEVHWHGRAFQIVESLRTGVYSYATSHLGHPGIFPAGLMGAGEWVGDQLNKHRGLVEGGPGFIHHLHSSRIPVVFFSSFAVPLLFLFLYRVTDLLTALLAALLLVSFPAHSFVSRMAHLDGSLTVIVMLTAMSYRRGVKSGKVSYLLLSALCFGMALATKPTALGLIPALYLWSRFATDQYSSDEAKVAPALWARLLPRREEIWILVLAQISFAAVFTRFWAHESVYFLEVVPNLPLADIVYQSFSEVHETGALGVILIVFLLLAGVYCHNWQNESRKIDFRLLAHAIWILATLLALGGLWPAIPENICRYWVRVLMLPGVAHESYGEVINSGYSGYLHLLVTETPLLIILGVLVTFVSSTCRWIHRERVPEWLKFSTLISICWIAMMSSSGKQTFRYVMPVIPFIVAIGAFGVVSFSRQGATRLMKLFDNGGFRKLGIADEGIFSRIVSTLLTPSRLMACLCAILLVPHLILSPVFSSNQPQGRYLNFLANNSLLLSNRNRTSAFVDVDKAIFWLHQQALREGRELWVNVAGDVSVASLVYHLQVKEKSLLRFRSSPWATGAEYALVFSGFHERMETTSAKELFFATRVYANYYNGQITTTVYRLARPSKTHPIDLEAYSAQKETGDAVELSEDLKIAGRLTRRLVRARTSRDKRGLLWFGQFVPSDPGKIKAQFYLRLFGGEKISLPETTPVINISISRNCSRQVSISEITDLNTPVVLECENSEFKVYHPQVIWYGGVSLEIAMIRVLSDSQTFDVNP